MLPNCAKQCIKIIQLALSDLAQFEAGNIAGLGGLDKLQLAASKVVVAPVLGCTGKQPVKEQLLAVGVGLDLVVIRAGAPAAEWCAGFVINNMDGFGCFIHRGNINLTRECNGPKLGLLAGKAKLGLLVGRKARLRVR